MTRDRRPQAALGWIAASLMAACAATARPLPTPSPSAPFSLSEADFTLLYWTVTYGDTVRSIFGASVNALANPAAAIQFPPLRAPAEVKAEWEQLGSQQACMVCTQTALACAGTPLLGRGLLLDARAMEAACYAMRNQPAPEAELPPTGGPTCGQLLRRACDACALQAAAPVRTPSLGSKTPSG